MKTLRKKTDIYFLCILMMIVFVYGCKSTSGNYIISDTHKISRAESKLLSESGKGHFYYFMQSEFAKKRGNFKAAVNYINKAIETDTDSLFLKKERIKLYIYTGQIPEALVSIEAQLKITPENVELLTILAQIKLSQNKDTETIDVYRKIIELNPKQQSAYYLLGGIYSKLNKTDKALDVFIQLVSVFPDASSGYYYMGRLYLVKNDYDNAEKAFNQAISISDTHLESLNALVEIYDKKKDIVKLQATYKKILEINPDSLHALLALVLINKDKHLQEQVDGFLSDISINYSSSEIAASIVSKYLKKGNIDRALELLNSLLEFKPDDNELLYLAGTCYNQKKNSQKAMGLFKKIQPDSTYYTNASLIRAFSYKDAGQYKKAVGILENAHSAKPENTDFVLYLGTFYEEADNLPSALSFYEKGIALDKKNTMFHFRAGVIFDKLNKRQSCIDKMKTVIEIDPENTNALNYLGYTYADMGMNLNEAETLIKKALSYKPDDAYITDSLGWLYYKKGNFKKATALLKKAVKLIPDDPILLEHLGDAFHKDDNGTKALEFYMRSLKNKKKDKEQLLIKIDNLTKDNAN